MNFIRRFSLPALMLTTLAASTVTMAGTATPAEAGPRDAFNNKYAKKFYLRGNCKITKHVFKKRDAGFGRKVRAIRSFDCIAKKRKSKYGLAVRPKGTARVTIKAYGIEKGKGLVFLEGKGTTCRGKKRCPISLAPKKFRAARGMTACIEAKGKSRIVHLGQVPAGLDNGFKSKKCFQRKF